MAGQAPLLALGQVELAPVPASLASGAVPANPILEQACPCDRTCQCLLTSQLYKVACGAR